MIRSRFESTCGNCGREEIISREYSKEDGMSYPESDLGLTDCPWCEVVLCSQCDEDHDCRGLKKETEAA